MSLILQILIIYCIRLRYCYDFKASGTVDLNKDNGWSQFGAACVGYLETANFTIWSQPSGTINVEFKVPLDAPNNTNYMLVFYDGQTNSFPKVNNNYLTCREKVDGPYRRLLESVTLEPGNTWSTPTITIVQHIRTLWWYFYLVNCDQSLTFAPIDYIYSYKDFQNDTKICPNTSGSGRRNILMWALIGIIMTVVIGLCIAFGVNYYKRKKQMKQSQQNENLLMDSLHPDQKDIAHAGNEFEYAYDLLKKWSLEQYGTVLIDERGYDDIEQWNDLNENGLQQMGFKEGHSKKFVKMVKKHFMDVLVETEVFDTEANNDDVIKEGIVEGMKS